MAASRRPALALLLALAFAAACLLSAASAAVDEKTCAALATKMGGAAALKAMAPNCDPNGGAFRASACCTQLKKVLAASGPTGKQCLCDKALFDKFVAMADSPAMPSAAIPFFLSTVCRIPIPGKGC